MINNYKQEVKKEQAKLESERHLFSESLLFFGYDTHEDDKEIMSKRLYEEHNVKQLNKEISDYVARVNFSANEITKYNKQNEALKRRLEVHNFEDNQPAKNLSLTIDTLKSSIEEKKKEILELNQEYSDYLKSISPKLELVHHMDNFYKAKKVFHQSLINDHNEVAVDFGKLIDLTIQKHFVYYKINNPHSEITLEELHQKLTSLAGKMDNNTYSEIKPLYEAEIENELGTGLIYNREDTTIVDIISEGKLQCYSGTSLYLILNFLKNPSLNNQVVISKDAHILPGYISIEEGKRILYGIETTAAGKATVKYGHSSSLQGKIRILDAKQYLLFDLYGFDNQKRKEVLTKMLTFSKEQYGINIEDLYSHDEEQIERKEKESFQFKINSSPLSFGKSAQAAGDIERQEFSQQDKTSTYEKVKVVEVAPIDIDENMESDSNYDDEYHKMILREIVISDFKYGNFRNFQVLSDESNDRSMKALVSSRNGERGDFIAERVKNSKGEDIIKVTVNGSEIYHCNDPVFLESKAYETKVAFMDQRIMCNKTEEIEEAKKGNYDTEVALFYSF
ncbi:hypothetical protein OAT67_00890 [Bacteriovoracaceae bacterium]|nr:hypothetical protein [Bacteriovoracaceae bacterium]